MRPSSDPPRMSSGSSDAPPSLSAALRSAAHDAPTSHELAQLASALLPMLAAPPPSVTPGDALNGVTDAVPGGAKLWSAAFAKGAATFAVVAACAAGGYGIWRSFAEPVKVTQNIAPAVLAEPEPEPIAPPQAPPRAFEPPAAETSPPPFENPPEAARGTANAVPPRPREPARAKGAASPTSTWVPDGPQAAAPSEWSLLELARRSVGPDPKKALSLVQEHHRRFAGGPLSEEADFIEIEAMKRLGRLDEARSLEDRFRKRYPSSMHGQSVQVRPPPTP